VAKTSSEVLDVKQENSKILSLMDIIISQRESKHDMKRRRDMKSNHKSHQRQNKAARGGAGL
jgi:hypothetical protein